MYYIVSFFSNKTNALLGVGFCSQGPALKKKSYMDWYTFLSWKRKAICKLYKTIDEWIPKLF